MNGFIAPTDLDWYKALVGRTDLTEVNFWQPSAGGGTFRVLAPGEPLLFKLKSPHNAIAGFGYFARYSRLPAWLAWDSFELGNGASSFLELHDRVKRYRQTDSVDASGNYEIGCILLASPVFFPERLWVPQPTDWKPQVMRGARYDLTHGEGRRVWDECQFVAMSMQYEMRDRAKVSPVPAQYGEPALVAPRLGQGIFRISVIDAYQRACSISEEHSLPALEAAHIRPFSTGGEHQISNGILLRSDIHRLFDRGYVTITPDFRVKVSQRLRADFSNGRSYYPYHGQKIRLPESAADCPQQDFLEWHNENVYLSA